MGLLSGRRGATMIAAEDALPGRDAPVEVAGVHFVHGLPTVPPWPEGHEVAVLGMGCFWGA